MSLHVECGLAGRAGASLPVEDAVPLWSETKASAGTTTNAVPSGLGLTPVLTLTPEVDMWIAIGPSPNAGADPRRRLKAGVQRSFIAKAGDKVAWA